MKLRRDVGGAELAKALGRLGYTITRQTGSHMRLTHVTGSTHHLTIPANQQLKVGTLSTILSKVAGHLALSKTELIKRFFGD
ncbi:MAG: type II toxin-antitoxin system HicA family toxin [Gammaproteobacteria bacterium]